MQVRLDAYEFATAGEVDRTRVHKSSTMLVHGRTIYMSGQIPDVLEGVSGTTYAGTVLLSN